MSRPGPPPIPLQADERTMLMAFLEFYRAALIDRAYGLDQGQLNTAHPPATLTLARLIGHMVLVEQTWFRDRLDDDGYLALWAELDWEGDPDAEMTLAESWTPEELVDHFAAAVADSNARIAAKPSLDDTSAVPNHEGECWSLRWILVHMIEEYARHCGHADLIREAVDGDVLS